MAERTKRAEEARKQQDDTTRGEPADDTREREAATKTMQVTRDKSVEPAEQIERDDLDDES